MEADYIIVGQGLAGSAVAAQLLKLKKRIIVFDDFSANNSSRIAAGLFNPVTGKKMTKTWLADVVFPYLQSYYREMEMVTGETFFSPMHLYRPFLSIEEQNEWAILAGDKKFENYVDRICYESLDSRLNDPCGGLLLKNSGFLNTTRYISAVGELIRRHSILNREKFFPEEIIFHSTGVSYKQYSASAVIWCHGTHQNLYFDWLPIRPLKGETLTIRADLSEDRIVNRGVYMVPDRQARNWKVGSTYYFHDREDGITEVARRDLEDRVAGLIKTGFEVVDQQWGFRPTTPDRRPILGRHPEFERLVIFNGLGTKGVSLAPYFSEVLIHWLEKGGQLHKEVDIERFKSVYSGSPKRYGVS